ncbi:class II glutamine amidotransferase [Sinomonas sp. ASV322]|uniref:class II glutamine amidotransferase n=1 Tax=Sinomonas sp. ASV322 TaxID=3041920 RepID=UPI0027DD91BB|nr:class II glutamine amidotransferase [Sinomonas sp. ASV322]MDQ4503556.1 class II glutamine amidotransferase [Sinomonas sp. ASV322]
MCRLFALHAGRNRAKATFWLLDAPDSLREQSHREPDGTGVGTFTPQGRPKVEKQAMAAWEDRAFAREARDLESTTFLAHVRYASTGAHTFVNTHPFEQAGRLFAHNGAFGGLERLNQRLQDLGTAGLVHGETDSERLFALITAETRIADGDVGAGITAAVSWIADLLPVFSLNFIMATATDLWALRYPETHELYVREDHGAPASEQRGLDATSQRITVRSPDLGDRVLVATERMDDDPRWRLMDPGELLHVGPDLRPASSRPFPGRPAILLSLSDLDAKAAASQRPHPA